MNELHSIAHRIMIERGLVPDFSNAARAEVDAAPTSPIDHGPDVRDLRKLLWASIDNDSSRDLDQLSAGEKTNDGDRVWVAVADVDAVVKRNSAVDQHAAANTTSVYTAGGIFPMLPERFSTDITSLNEGEDRMAIVIEMVVDHEGHITSSDVFRAVVQNRAKLAYNSVAAWLDGKSPAPDRVDAVPGLGETLKLQDRVAQAMRRARFLKGALSLHTPAAEPVFDGDQLSDLRPDEPNRAKELIEDFMVAANGVVAKFLAKKGFSSIRRVLRSPERWLRIVDLAQTFGERLPGAADGEALAKFLAHRQASDPGRFSELSLAVVKLLGRGEYMLDLPNQKAQGHFGLAVNDYTHSTAPNRRFPDLITQRLVKAALHGQAAPYSNDELATLAHHCTEQEGNAAKVERQVAKSAAAELLVSRVGYRFEGVVTGASPKGVFVRISHPTAEGKVVRGADGLDVGDRVQVQLLDANVERGFIDFAAHGRHHE